MEEEKGSITEVQRLDRIKAKEESQEVVFQEEINWRQKSRINWLLYGDCNTKFFHSFGTCRKMKNHISLLFIDGMQVDDLQKTETGIASFFKQLYTDNHSLAGWFTSWTANPYVPIRVYGWKGLLLRSRLNGLFFLWHMTKALGQMGSPWPSFKSVETLLKGISLIFSGSSIPMEK